MKLAKYNYYFFTYRLLFSLHGEHVNKEEIFTEFPQNQFIIAVIALFIYFSACPIVCKKTYIIFD